jgi:hypothetical protein
MICNVGNQVGPSWHWLQPHKTKNIGKLAIGHLTPKKWHRPWRSWPSDNTQCQYSILKVQTQSYTLWEDNICLGHELLSHFIFITLITTYNLVFAIFLPSRASCMPIFFFIMNHTKWTHGIECQPLIDLMEMICNLGNQIGPQSHGLQPHTTKNISIFGILAILQPGDNSQCQCQYYIPKAQTHPYTLWEVNICLGHGLLSFFYSAHS